MSDLAQLMRDYDVLGGFWMTIKLTVVSALGSLVLGVIVAIMRVSPVKAFQIFGKGYVNIIRNTPLTVIVTFCALAFYNVLAWKLAGPDARSSVQLFWWGVVALSVYHSTFVAEGIRSGINTVPSGQAEAARSIGLTFGQTLGEVIFPQAIRAAVTPLGNTLISLTKNTTVVSAIGVAEASYVMKNMIEFSPQFIYAIFILMALGFVILTLPIGMLVSWGSTKLAVQR
ncbi:Arginine transport system permease protein ArtQ [Acidipropionibacterium jensenii]|uniref:Arginine transport system permease protein ArtQ n=1 Tax=Acidipropionibacterium jensenii TaxID=1749 RepID=A0A448NYT9_9ACTN|nr:MULTISPECIES: amino acid ABC transporter permease [Acidipropionibacterium]VEI03109.1 Arginine transport system permease protein ArtQ [Acidipropionibacterium jensenii]